ncbi:MAG: hypothetical protein NTW96_25515 [Planctomycetia bacterium]|nr:hypothetical protein [Planctomycetia bacterium]
MEIDYTNPIGHLQLFIRDEAVSKGLIQAGHYGIPESDEKVIDLGVSVDVIPLARRPKAIDITDSENVVVSYDMESEEFKRIAAKAFGSGLQCQYGPSFLVFERSTGRFLEFFCGTKSSRIEANKIFAFLPLTQADIDAKAAAGNDVSDLKPHGPIPVTLKVMAAENRKGTWHIPAVAKCSSPFDTLPDMSVIAEKTADFFNVKRAWSLDRIAQEENRVTKPRANSYSPMMPEKIKTTEMPHSQGKPFPWRCPECGKKEVRPATVQHTSQIKHDGRLYTVEVPTLRVPRCGACGEMVFDNDADEQIAQALREQLGLLSGDQIRKNRDDLGLS